MLVLRAFNKLTNQLSGENWVFAQILKVASIARLTRQINAAAKRHVETLCAQLPSNERAVFVSSIQVPTRSRGKIAWQRSRVTPILSARTQAVGRIGHLNSRNP